MASLPETGNSAINAAQASVALSADSKPGDAYHRLNPLSRWLEPTSWIVGPHPAYNRGPRLGRCSIQTMD